MISGRFLILLLIFGLVAIIVYNLNKRKLDKEREEDEKYFLKNESKVTDKLSGDTSINNKVLNVPLTGGIIGFIGDSPQNTLNRKIRKQNLDGWRVIQIIPSSSGNILLLIFRIILLIITLFLYTTTNGYYVIMERKQEE